MPSYPTAYRTGASKYSHLPDSPDGPGLSFGPPRRYSPEVAAARNNANLLREAIERTDERNRYPNLYEIFERDRRNGERHMQVREWIRTRNFGRRMGQVADTVAMARRTVPLPVRRSNPWSTALDVAMDLYPLVKSKKLVLIGMPPGWKRVAGAFAYGWPYNHEGLPWVSPTETYHAPLTGQYVTHAYGNAITDTWPGNQAGVWIQSENPWLGGPSPFHAHHSSYVREFGTEGGTVELVKVAPAVDLQPTSAPGTVTRPLVGYVVKPHAPPYWALARRPAVLAAPSEMTTRGQPNNQPEPSRDSLVQVATFPATGGPPVIVERPEVRSPPKQGVRERKSRSQSWGIRAIKAIVNPLTEGLDVLNVLYDAIPPEDNPFYRRNRKGELTQRYRPNPTEMAEFVWNNVDKIDVAKAVRGLAENALEDQLIGRASSVTTREAQGMYDLLKRPVGVFTGPAL